MEDKNILEWRNTILSASSALESRDFQLYEKLMEEANNIVDKIKKDDELTYECKNFGMSNYIFEDALPRLFKSNKKAVREFMNTLKEDKNLLTQFHFFKAVDSCNNISESKGYIEDLLNIAESKIDKKTLNESNKKLSDIIKKYNIKPSEKISDDKLTFFESCDYLFSNKKKMTNLSEINKNIEIASEFINKNKSDKLVESSKLNNDELLNEFEKKYSTLFNEEEKAFTKKMLFGTNEEKKYAFNELKNGCLEKIGKSLECVNESEDVNDFEVIKEQVTSMGFNEGTYYNDIKKILLIMDVLDN